MARGRGRRAGGLLLAGLVAVSVTAAILSGVVGGGTTTTAASFVDRTPTVTTSHAPDVSMAGVFSAQAVVPIAYLSLVPGEYIIEYSFESRFHGAYGPTTFSCGLVDANAPRRRALLHVDPTVGRTGAGWQQHAAGLVFGLSDVTLALRCVPERTGLILADFREVQFVATRLR